MSTRPGRGLTAQVDQTSPQQRFPTDLERRLHRNYSRRRFLRTAGIAGGGLVVGFSLGGCSPGAPPLKAVAGAFAPNAFLQITPDSLVRFYCPRDEMGQGVTTGLTTLVAEELDVAPSNLYVEFAGVHSDYANPEYGFQGTGGSTSVKAHYQQLRQVGADVRAVLLEAAALDLGVARERLATDDGHVVIDGRRLPYGQFVASAAKLTVPEGSPLKKPIEFKYIGKSFPRLDGLAKATGTAVYGIDVEVPGMHHAVVKRSPVAGGLLKSADVRKAEAMSGVTDVVTIASGVAVVAKKHWQAKVAADALDLEWNLPALAQVSTEQVKADYAAAMAAEEGESAAAQGDAHGAFDAAQTVLENEYWAPYLAHAPMEPMNAVVRVENGEADVWTGSQGPPAAQGLVARYAGLDVEQVRSHQTHLGGAFGRRATLTHVIEATQIAVATKKPIHLLWSREDDLKGGVYRPASLVKLKAGLDSAGKINAWVAKRVGGNITPDTLGRMLPALLPGLGDGLIDWSAGLASGLFDGWVVDPLSVEGLNGDYDLPNHEVLHVTKDHGLPLTFWRSVGHSFTAFAKETMVDELAEKEGIDGVELRLRNTRNNLRLNNVIRVAGERMGAMQPGAGRTLGFAAHSSFGTYVAEVAEVSVAQGGIKVHKVFCVVDCGRAINPDIVRAQMEGAVMYGLTAALHGDLELENGEIRQSNFHDYPILRMDAAPAVEVAIIDSDEAPTGVGEPGLPPIAPAVANAVYRATGQRLRSLPLRVA